MIGLPEGFPHLHPCLPNVYIYYILHAQIYCSGIYYINIIIKSCIFPHQAPNLSQYCQPHKQHSRKPMANTRSILGNIQNLHASHRVSLKHLAHLYQELRKHQSFGIVQQYHHQSQQLLTHHENNYMLQSEAKNALLIHPKVA